MQQSIMICCMKQEGRIMVRELMHDPMFLGIKSKPATKEDAAIARDLLDTLIAHRETCVGMAANMIGKAVRIIVFIDGAKPSLMFNPEIISKAAPYETEEGCLSLLGAPSPACRGSQFAQLMIFIEVTVKPAL